MNTNLLKRVLPYFLPVIIFAASLGFGSSSQIDLTVDGRMEPQAVVPGSTFDLDQTITNNGGEGVYVFVEVTNPLYVISGLNDGWTLVDGFAMYADGEAMTPLEPGETVGVKGIVTLEVDNKTFAGLTREGLKFDVDTIGVLASEGSSPQAVLRSYFDWTDAGDGTIELGE